MLRLTLSRRPSEEVQTLGKLVVHDECYRHLFTCYSLELADNENKTSKSRIPAGLYDVVKRTSAKFKDHFHILDVTGRKWILIHSGNTHHNTRGCILVGRELQYIDGDSYLDVTDSKNTLAKLRDLLPDSFQMQIRDDYK